MMHRLHINLKTKVNNSYSILIGTSLSEAAKDIVRLRLGSKYYVITDTNVGKLYGKQFVKAIARHTDNVKLLKIPAGERNKNRRTKELLEDKLFKTNAGRDSVIIALGGGVIGDLAGFVSATLHRGVPYIQIPTTLLAQVDSSIGGKVAVNHPLGKNLIGAFYQPKKVYIDVSTLKTLPHSEFINGMAEVIKYSAILDKKLFSYLEANKHQILKRKKDTLVHLIKRCCECKRIIVERDEREHGLRRILNFGHTVGHALEIVSTQPISHGKAIAIGMVAEAKISATLGLCSNDDVKRLENLLQLYGLPTSIPSNINLRKLFAATAQDKKSRQGIVHYTLLETIGKAQVGIPLSYREALSLFLQ